MRRPSHRTRITVRATIATASLIVMVGSGLAWASYRGFTADVPHGAPVPTLAKGVKDRDGKAQNILLLGNDSRAGATPAELRALSTENDGGSVNTDTMMVLHIPADGSKATVVSFPRDSWVTVPGYGLSKLNAAYPDAYSAELAAHGSEVQAESAGVMLVIKTITALTGLHIDHYVQVNLLGFYRISNAIGGVTVCLNNAQNAHTDSDAYGSGYSGINLPKGVSVIKGTQALAFVRQRHGLPQGDLDRVRRQQYFLSAAFRQVTSSQVLLNPFRLQSLLKAVSSSLLTDPALNLLSLGREFADLSAGNLTFQTLPNKGPQTIYPDGVETAIVALDPAAIPGFVDALTGKVADPQLAKAAAAAPSSVTLDVYNATSTAHLAADNAASLKARGFHVDIIDSLDSTATTVVQYPPGAQAAAKAVAAQVSGAALVETSSVPRVRLILGGDGRGVRAISTASSGPAASRPAAAKPAPAAGLGCID